MANLTTGCDKWWKHVIWSSKSDNWKDNMSDNKAQEWHILYEIFHRLFSKVNLTNIKKSKTYSSNNPISKNIKKEKFNQFSSRQIPFFLIKNTWTCPKYLMMRVFLQSLSDKVYNNPLQSVHSDINRCFGIVFYVKVENIIFIQGFIYALLKLYGAFLAIWEEIEKLKRYLRF